VAEQEVVSVGWTTNPQAAYAGYRAAHPFAWWVRYVIPVLFVVTGLLRGDLFGVVFGAAVYFMLGMSIRRQLGASARGELDHLLTATDEELRVDGGSRPWTAFRSAKRREGHWVLRLNQAVAFAVPVAAFDDEEATRFVDLLRSKQLLK
jgi:hypothetical protein